MGHSKSLDPASMTTTTTNSGAGLAAALQSISMSNSSSTASNVSATSATDSVASGSSSEGEFEKGSRLVVVTRRLFCVTCLTGHDSAIRKLIDSFRISSSSYLTLSSCLTSIAHLRLHCLLFSSIRQLPV